MNALNHQITRPHMTTGDFSRITKFAMEEAGLAYTSSKKTLIESRLGKRLIVRRLRNFTDYCDVLDNPAEAAERKTAISLLTTNVTSFFREKHHFDHLQKVVLPMLRTRLEAELPVRFWSAGCSTGQEAYSLMMTVIKAWPDVAEFDFRMLATDIDPDVIHKAEAGVYQDRELTATSATDLDRFTREHSKGGRQVSDNVKQLIRFKELNLLHPWPMKGKFDVVFCRNVVIYFAEETQQELWHRFGQVTRPSSWLYLGHSERITGETPFISKDQTTYQRNSLPAP